MTFSLRGARVYNAQSAIKQMLVISISQLYMLIAGCWAVALFDGSGSHKLNMLMLSELGSG